MDLSLSDDQQALVETVARFAADRFPIEVVRAFGEPGGFDRAAWAELAALGTFGIALPEADGGVGLGVVDAVLVHEALGGALTPGPLVAASLAAGVVDGVVDGSVVPALALRPRQGPAVVEHLRDADVLLVVDDDGVSALDPANLDRREIAHPTDPTTPVTVVAELPAGAPVADAGTAATWRALGSLLASAQLVGLSYAATDLAVAYATERHQFGRAIGSFQALKHLMADSLVRSEVARSAVWSAGVTADEPDVGDLDRAVAGARLAAARAGTENAKTATTVHGGMGYTWEVDAHLFLKRAMVLQVAVTTPDEAAEVVAASVAAEV